MRHRGSILVSADGQDSGTPDVTGVESLISSSINFNRGISSLLSLLHLLVLVSLLSRGAATSLSFPSSFSLNCLRPCCCGKPFAVRTTPVAHQLLSHPSSVLSLRVVL